MKVAYGYRPCEVGVNLGLDNHADPSFKVTRIRPGFYQTERRPVRVSVGCEVEGLCMPVPDLNHAPSQLAGLVKRVAAEMPPILGRNLRKFKRFVRRFCKKYLNDLTFDGIEDFEFEEWISNAPYPEYRKEELRRVFKESLDRSPITIVKAFTKDECYDLFKFLRGIHARHDDYKVRVGPFAKKFGDRLFKMKWFIKKIPVSERPSKLLEALSGFDKIFCTDFSQFEATFVKSLMSIELWVYNWTLRNHPMQKQFNDLFACLVQTNVIDYKYFTVHLNSKRMSGEMFTSCGNGLMNLLMTMFILENNGNDLDKVGAYFEGDDGIIGCTHLPTKQDYTDLGANIKIEIPKGINTASFCGNVFDPIAKHNVRNPMEAAVCFGWINGSYLQASVEVKMKLLRVKSMSLLSEYPGCPILRSLAWYGIRNTRKYKKIDKTFLTKNFSKDTYKFEQVLDMFETFDERNLSKIEVHKNSRVLVEEMYNIPVSEQLRIEHYLDNLHSIQPLTCFNSLESCTDWYIYNREYVVNFETCRDKFVFTKSGYETRCLMKEEESFIVRS